MSRQVRHRVTALVLGGLLLGAPLLTNGTASADQVDGGGRQVVFAGGGVLGLSCRSQPSVESMTVAADSTVLVVNRTGHSAQLELGGTTKGTVPDDGSTEVMFRRGTTAVLLSPGCTLGDEATPLLVTATPADPTTMPDPIAAPPDSDASVTPADSDSPPAAAGAGAALPDSVAPATHQQRPPTATASRPGAVRTAGSRPAATAAEAMPQGGSAPRIKTRILRGTDTAPRAFSGMPPGDDKAILPGVPTVGLSSGAQAEPPAAAAPSAEIAAAEPVASMRPMSSGSGRVGLLALIAAVCVLGVGIGAIRAIVSQRASRTKIA
jgi:hypothetical protein